MAKDLAELWRYRDLLRQLVRRQLKVRYNNSALGFLWSIVPPILELLIFSFLVRSGFGLSAKNYGAYLLCGLLPWKFMQSAVEDSNQSLLLDYSLIKKVYMPREVIPLAYVISNFIHFLLAWVVFFVGFFIVARFFGGGVPILPSIVLFPFITLFLFLFVTGFSLWAAALRVFYTDITFILSTIFRMVFFLLPVIYPAEMILYLPSVQAHPWLGTLYMLNPITAFMDTYRKAILEPMPAGSFRVDHPFFPINLPIFLVACLISVLVAWGGYAYFNYRKWEFVERS